MILHSQDKDDKMSTLIVYLRLKCMTSTATATTKPTTLPFGFLQLKAPEFWLDDTQTPESRRKHESGAKRNGVKESKMKFIYVSQFMEQRT